MDDPVEARGLTREDLDRIRGYGTFELRGARFFRKTAAGVLQQDSPQV